MKIMDRTGHTTLEYQLEQKDKVAKAKQVFDQKVEEGYAPFVKLEDGTFTRIQEDRFDANAEYLLRPPIQGG